MPGWPESLTGDVLDVAPRLLRGPSFFPVAEGLSYGLRAWLLDTSEDREADVLFYNYLTREAVAPSASLTLDWEGDPAGASAAEGAELLAAITRRLVAGVAEWRVDPAGRLG